MTTRNKKNQLQYIYPPDLQKCRKHRLASRIFKGNQKQNNTECQCCERKLGNPNPEIQCCYSTAQLAFLGTGVPLLFIFIKNGIILLLEIMIIFSGFAIYSNIKGGFCQSNSGICSDGLFDIFAVFNKFDNVQFLTIQNYLLIGCVVAIILMMHYFRYDFRKVQVECPGLITLPSDYSLILRRLPVNTTKADIEVMIEEKRKQLSSQQKEKTEDLKIINIVMSFEMSEYCKIKQQNIEQFHKLLSSGKYQQFQPKPLPALIKQSSFAVVVFARKQSTTIFEYHPNIFQKLLHCICLPCIPLSNFTVKQTQISIERAPQPDDIVWQNGEVTMNNRICRKTIFSVISILVLLCSGAVLGVLAWFQLKMSADPTMQLLMNVVFAVVVTVLNFVIEFFFILAAEREKNQTVTEMNRVLIGKIGMFQFIFAGIFVLIVKQFVHILFSSLFNGIVFQITLIMILNALIPNLLLIIVNYCQIIKKIKRRLLKKDILKYSQYEANLLYEGPPTRIPEKYIYIIRTIWLSAFYAPLVPIVVPISIIGLIINYFLQKLLYGRVYASPSTVTSMVNNSSIQLLDYTGIFISIGQLVLYLYLQFFKPGLFSYIWGIPILVSLFLSIINCCLPMDFINTKIFKSNMEITTNPSYQNVQNNFDVTYQMTNPGYLCQRKRRNDLLSYHKKQEHNVTGNTLLSKRTQINQTEQQNIFDNIQNMNNEGVKKNRDKKVDGQELIDEENQEDEGEKNGDGEMDNEQEKKKDENVEDQQVEDMRKITKKKVKVSPPVFGFPSQLPTGFSSNLLDTPISGNIPINMKGIRLRATPIPVVPEDEQPSSASSTKEVRRAFKLELPVLHPFTRSELEQSEQN